MFSHIMVGANDIQKSKLFYDAVLGALGYDPAVMDEKGRCFYLTKSGEEGFTHISIDLNGSGPMPRPVFGLAQRIRIKKSP